LGSIPGAPASNVPAFTYAYFVWITKATLQLIYKLDACTLSSGTKYCEPTFLAFYQMADLQQRSPADFLKEDNFAAQSAIANHMIDRHDTPIKLAAALLYAVGIAVIVILIWSAVTVVPEVSVAPGQVVPRGHVKLIEPSSDGIIEKILVKEGQHVNAGDKLVLLDRVPYIAAVDKSTKELEIAKSHLKEHELAIEALQQIIHDPGHMPNIQVDVANVSQIISDVYKNHSQWIEAQKDTFGKIGDSLGTESGQSDFGNKGGGTVIARTAPIGTAGGQSEMSLINTRLQNAGAEKAAARTTLEKRKKEFLERKNALAIETSSLQQQLKSLKGKRFNLELILGQTRTQASEMKTALEAGGLSRLQYLDALKSVEQAEMALVDHDNEVEKMEHSLESAKSAQAEFENKAHADVAQLESSVSRASSDLSDVALQQRVRHRNMSEAESVYLASLAKARAALSQETDEKMHQEAKIRQTEAELTSAQNSLERAEITSPIEGTVTAIKLRGKGQVVSSKEIMMSVVPLINDLVVEAQLPNKDRGFVKAGQKVKLKFSSFPFQDFGVLHGDVIEVENFPRDITKLGGYYRVLVAPEQQAMKVHGKEIPFAPGMTVTAEIITRYRSVLNIICEPLKKLTDARWN
jgi:multidrug resistance efflux pump